MKNGYFYKGGGTLACTERSAHGTFPKAPVESTEFLTVL